MTFTGAVKSYFGLREGQNIQQFASELRELTYDDKLEIAEMLSELTNFANLLVVDLAELVEAPMPSPQVQA